MGARVLIEVTGVFDGKIPPCRVPTDQFDEQRLIDDPRDSGCIGALEEP
jgi:hypothetical protein